MTDHFPDATKKAERRRKYAQLIELLDKWENDPTDFDETVAPLIESALREASPRLFPDESERAKRITELTIMVTGYEARIHALEATLRRIRDRAIREVGND